MRYSRAHPSLRTISRSNELKVTLVIVLATLVSFGYRIYQLSFQGSLYGLTEFDDGIYFGTAVRIVHGIWPYKDFAFMQPPGLPLLISPIAFLSGTIGTREGFALARILTTAVGAANVLALGKLLRHRGAVSVLVGCATLASFPSAILAAHTLMLEPYLTLFCLLGALCVFDRDRIVPSPQRLALGGVFFGIAGSILSWAVLPVLVIAALTVTSFRHKFVPFAAGVTVGFFALTAPYLLTSPATFVHDVIIAQLGMVTRSRLPEMWRLQYLTGVYGSGLPLTNSLVWRAGTAILVFVLGAFVTNRKRLSALDAFSLLTTVVVGAVFLIPPRFYYHFGAFFAPFLACSLALAASRWMNFWKAFQGRIAWIAGRATTGVCGLLGTALLAGGAHFLRTQPWLPSGDPGLIVNRMVPKGACVVTDVMAETISANRFVSTDPNCPRLVDPFATDVTLGNGKTPGAGGLRDAAVQRRWMSYFERAQYLVLDQAHSPWIPWDPQLTSYMATHFAQLNAPGVLIYKHI